MDNTLTTALLALMYAAFFIAGFLIGKNTDKLEQTLSDPSRLMTNLSNKTAGMGANALKSLPRVGAVPTITQEQIYLRDNPRIKEETEAMSEVFNSLGVDKVKK